MHKNNITILRRNRLIGKVEECDRREVDGDYMTKGCQGTISQVVFAEINMDYIRGKCAHVRMSKGKQRIHICNRISFDFSKPNKNLSK